MSWSSACRRCRRVVSTVSCGRSRKPAVQPCSRSAAATSIMSRVLPSPPGRAPPARGGAGGIGAPGEESGLHAVHVRIGNDAVAGLQELDWGNVARVAGQLALLGVDQPVAVLAEIEFVQGDAGRDRRPLHHLGDGGEDSPMLRRVIDMVDVERLRDVPELHVHRPYIDELAGFQRGPHGLRIDIIRGPSRRPSDRRPRAHLPARP